MNLQNMNFAKRLAEGVNLNSETFAVEMTEACRMLLQQAQAMKIPDFRLYFSFDQRDVKPVLELDPISYWCYWRSGQATRSPGVQRIDLTDYITELSVIVPSAQEYYESLLLIKDHEELKFKAQCEIKPPHLNSTLSFVDIVRQRFTPAETCNVQEGRFKCATKIQQQLVVKLNGDDENSNYCVIRGSEPQVPELLIMAKCNVLGAQHNNLGMVQDPEFWEFFKKLLLKLEMNPVCCTVNFGNWETNAQLKKSTIDKCHSHFHVFLNCDYATKSLLHNHTEHYSPDLSRDKNREIIMKERLEHAASLVRDRNRFEEERARTRILQEQLEEARNQTRVLQEQLEETRNQTAVSQEEARNQTRALQQLTAAVAELRIAFQDRQ